MPLTRWCIGTSAMGRSALLMMTRRGRVLAMALALVLVSVRQAPTIWVPALAGILDFGAQLGSGFNEISATIRGATPASASSGGFDGSFSDGGGFGGGSFGGR